MEIEVLEKDELRARFVVRGVNTEFVNALRRAMLAEVPTMAIEDVVFFENSSILHDEIIAHRLALIPLKTDLDSYLLPEECGCGSELGCNRCRVILTLSVEAGDERRTVYSGDLSPDDPEVKPVYDNIPIVVLAPRQSLKLEAYARLGRGKDHAKWQPVSVCTHKYYPSVEVDSERCDLCGKCVEICPRKVLAIEEGSLKVVNLLSCTLCEDCVRACPKNPPAIRVSPVPEAFIFNIESTGSLPVDRIVEEAAKVLEKKLSEFWQKLEELG